MSRQQGNEIQAERRSDNLQWSYSQSSCSHSSRMSHHQGNENFNLCRQLQAARSELSNLRSFSSNLEERLQHFQNRIVVFEEENRNMRIKINQGSRTLNVRHCSGENGNKSEYRIWQKDNSAKNQKKFFLMRMTP